MPSTTASLKTHTGIRHNNGRTLESGEASKRYPSVDRQRTWRHITTGNATPTPAQQLSEYEDESWSLGGRAGCGGRVKKAGNKKGQTEVEVIRDWFVKIFQPVEKTVDLIVTDFKFEQLNRTKPKVESSPNGRSEGEQEVRLPFVVLKKAEVELLVGGISKSYSVVIKVLPTDDNERYDSRKKFCDLLKFSKEVQIYSRIISCMVIFDEKRYASACVEPPVPKCYFGQLDAHNDVLVFENLEHSGYRKYNGGKYLTDMDHCRVVLRRIAQFHAFSTLIQRDADQRLYDLFPFAVDATIFSEIFHSRMAVVKTELAKYLCDKSTKMMMGEAERKVERHLQELFWNLVELRAQPSNIRMSVLVHGALDINNVMFQYDESSGRPICAKFLDFSCLTVSSPVIDISYFLHSSVVPEVASQNHSGLLQYYHRAHTDAIKSFGMHGYEMELEDMLSEYHSIRDYGSMTACLLKPALYVLQCMNEVGSKESGDEKHGSTNNRTSLESSNLREDTNSDGLNDFSEHSRLYTEVRESINKLKIDKNKVPMDSQLRSCLSTIAKECPCPCSVGRREMTISELSKDSLDDLHKVVKLQKSKLDCKGGAKTNLKKFIFGFGNNSNEVSNNSKDDDHHQSKIGVKFRKHKHRDS